ncbi:hypothetical protein [Gracilimonas sp.]|uniref:hypothetical protein n=1 Tax=Gracilimonas sp. TaxID=1974203 RepID=UPI002870FBD9|nr:hypothetical protein [Gracilimonas sp.]
MFYRLLSLNWRIFISNLNRFQLLLTIGYILFLGIMLVNLVGTAIVVVLMDSDPWMQLQLPWLTPEIYSFILLVFGNVYWVMHFSFTNMRLMNIEENRKLLGFGFPLKRLAKYLTVIVFCHPVNIIYNFTWLVFLLIQIQHAYQIPVAIAAVALNYVLIYSIKSRFIRVVEKRFIAVVIGFLFLIFGLFQFISLLTSNSGQIIAEFIPKIETINLVFSWLPGGILIQTVTIDYGLTNAAIIFTFTSILVGLLVLDHFNKTKAGLLNPGLRKAEEESSKLWIVLRKILGRNAGKYYFYVMKHPYNRLQVLTLAVIPVVYVPLLLNVNYEIAQTILIPTILAGIPVALLAMGMANMYGYENREFLLHLQMPIKLEKQLKERFLGVIVLPLLVFYLITVFELLVIPEIGRPIEIFVANTFFFLMFMLLFIWSSYFQYQKATYSSFSYKHPIIPQKVTFAISFLIFSLGYLVFVPLNGLEWYRLTIMSTVIVIMGIYLWRQMDVLVNLFKNRVLMKLWNEL